MARPDVSHAFAALGDPTRLAILSRLAGEGELTVRELAQPFSISLPAVSQHLKVLEHAGLITRRRDGQRRPCQIRPERLNEAMAWLNFTRRAWEARFDRLERFLQLSDLKGLNDDPGE
ncbi:ArsR/SmtB family transcription factor [Phenylobacterium immobile]|uniref:ArsR/SmtB family transcription factor n=1 Tax=Phenylobacterium immobile TaxID=21 RepID=UPI000AE319FD|nr:metalloregulator ArsR/SmtB family transcription factor [Phenylobacterium immobile]